MEILGMVAISWLLPLVALAWLFSSISSIKSEQREVLRRLGEISKRLDSIAEPKVGVP